MSVTKDKSKRAKRERIVKDWAIIKRAQVYKERLSLIC